MGIKDIIVCGVYLIIALTGTTLIKKGGMENPLFSICGIGISMKLIAGVLFYGISFLIYVFYIARMKISITIPILNAINTSAIVLIGTIVFSEKIVPGQIAGIVTVVIGVIVIGVFS